MKPVTYLSFLITIFFAAGCSSQSNFKEKRVTIPAHETVRINEIDLSIHNKGCGRKWVSEGDKPSFERPYCDLEIKRGGKSITAGGDFKPVYIGNVEIVLEKINPWGREEDSVPPGGCRVWVKLREGR